MAMPETNHKRGHGNRWAITIVAIAVGGVAAYLGIGGVTTLYYVALGNDSFGAVAFGLFFSSIMLLISFWFAALSVRAFQDASPRVVTGLAAAVGLTSWFAIVFCFTSVEITFGGLSSSSWDNVVEFVAIVIATGTFLFARWFMSPSHGVDWSIPGLCIGAICLFFYFAGFNVVHDLAPKEPGYRHVLRYPWGPVALLVPLTGAICLGKFLSRNKLNRDQTSSSIRTNGTTT